MRLHSLEMRAFGPFAEPTAVDFDELSEASVFLLCGDTGAGKTTVLDAVCFALYGDVPNERGRAKQLRSHHAGEAAPPQVRLETTIAGHRLRFTRSPAWQRPKRRGSGTTTEQARVLVEQADEAGWRMLTNRLDEAGHLVTERLGMTLGQFSQVVLLPQGQFDTFLRASSEDRHKVLTQLFRTSRFEDVERWLAERRTTLRRAGDTHRDAVTALLHRTSEATGVPLPVWAGDLTAACDDGDLEGWIAGLDAETGAALGAATDALSTAATTLRASESAHQDGLRLHDLRGRHDRAAASLARLAAGAAQAAAERQALADARRADRVLPLATAADRAGRRATDRQAEAQTALAAVAALLETDADLARPDDAALAEQARRATERSAVARRFLPRAQSLAQTRARLGILGERCASLTARHRELAERTTAYAARRADLETDLVAARQVADRLPDLRLRVVELGKLVSQFAILDELEFQVTDFSEKRDQQRLVTLALRERLVEVRERRLHGMAAELAQAMAVGADCPVCGSADHPAPARPTPGAPTADDEKALRDKIDDAEVLLETHTDQVRGYQARRDALRTELGERTSAQVLGDLQSAESAHAEAQAGVERMHRAEAALAGLRQAELDDTAALSRAEADLRVAQEQYAATEQSIAQITAELADLLGGEGDAGDLRDLVEHSDRAIRLLEGARQALAEQQSAQAQAERARASAAEAATVGGFASLDEVRAAALPAERMAALEARIEARARAEAEAAGILADPEVQGAAAAPVPDLEALEADHAAAKATHDTAVATAHAARTRRDQLLAHAVSLRAAVHAWGPVRAEYAVARSLAEFAEGKGPDNTRQMRLSAYVVAARLSQVVAAANERLGRMSDDRYTLEHTADRGVGERRGGLSLVVRDQWTDEVRDPVTLSGGETFVVSLALALGLADVVTGEAGGARIETLFVDEGFGTLDSDTLELVMDTLDQLREGGRVVGVVSHVPELRSRIPAQLVVHKTRTGSRVEQRLGVG